MPLYLYKLLDSGIINISTYLGWEDMYSEASALMLQAVSGQMKACAAILCLAALSGKLNKNC